MTASTSTARRTQAMRRETTRTALLDAAIACLIERGYAGVTTVDIADRAGVTRGAQLRYFATKDDLMVAAVRHLNDRIAAELLRTLPVPAAGARIELEALLDALWEFHTTPVFAASAELFIAARTDPIVRAQLKPLESDVLAMARSAAASILPDFAEHKGAEQVLVATLSTMRGLALLSALYDETSLAHLWRGHREDLLRLWGATWLDRTHPRRTEEA